MKPEAIWEIENGLKLSARDVSRASMGRTAWYQSFRKLLESYEFFLLPSAQLFAFDAKTHWPKEVAGHRMDTYHRWMEIVAPITMTGCPALAAPVGFNDQGLAMGMQIVGRNQAELSCLQLAFAYDQVSGWTRHRLPPLLRPT